MGEEKIEKGRSTFNDLINVLKCLKSLVSLDPLAVLGRVIESYNNFGSKLSKSISSSLLRPHDFKMPFPNLHFFPYSDM